MNSQAYKYDDKFDEKYFELCQTWIYTKNIYNFNNEIKNHEKQCEAEGGAYR